MRDPSFSPVFSGYFAGTPVKVLIDSGASTSFVSLSFCARVGLQMRKLAATVALADGQNRQISGICTAKLRLQQNAYSEKLNLHVLQLVQEYDIILGEDWLAAHRVNIDYGAGIVKGWHHNKQFTLQQCIPSSLPALHGTLMSI